MTQVLNMTSPNREAHSSANGSVQPILSQPASTFNETPEMAQDLHREKREDCCCTKFFLCRCLRWWCEMFGECAESWFRGFADCLNSCCDPNKNQDCCFGGECNDCEAYRGDDGSSGSYGGDCYEDDGYIPDICNDDNGYDGGTGDDGGTWDDGGTCDDGGGGYDGGTCDDGGGGYDGGTCDD